MMMMGVRRLIPAARLTVVGNGNPRQASRRNPDITRSWCVRHSPDECTNFDPIYLLINSFLKFCIMQTTCKSPPSLCTRFGVFFKKKRKMGKILIKYSSRRRLRRCSPVKGRRRRSVQRERKPPVVDRCSQCTSPIAHFCRCSSHQPRWPPATRYIVGTHCTENHVGEYITYIIINILSYK